MDKEKSKNMLQSSITIQKEASGMLACRALPFWIKLTRAKARYF